MFSFFSFQPVKFQIQHHQANVVTKDTVGVGGYHLLRMWGCPSLLRGGCGVVVTGLVSGASLATGLSLGYGHLSFS